MLTCSDTLHHIFPACVCVCMCAALHVCMKGDRTVTHSQPISNMSRRAVQTLRGTAGESAQDVSTHQTFRPTQAGRDTTCLNKVCIGHKVRQTQPMMFFIFFCVLVREHETEPLNVVLPHRFFMWPSPSFDSPTPITLHQACKIWALPVTLCFTIWLTGSFFLNNWTMDSWTKLLTELWETVTDVLVSLQIWTVQIIDRQS